MYVDALMLEYPAGIRQQFIQQVSVNTYPNPAKGILNVELNKEVRNGTFDIYDSEGKMVGSFPATLLKNVISVSNLKNGIYYFRLMSDKQFLNTGSFVISN